MEKSLQIDIVRWMATKNVPSVSVAFIQNGVIEARVFGVADAKTKQRTTTETVFQAASITKPLFAYIVMTLAQQGTIDLDKPLSEYLPTAYIPDEPRLNAITARRVLCHTTGFPNWRRDKPLKIYFNPGERWSYSGEGYVYLQKVVEHITQDDFNELADSIIFDALDMNRSHLIWVQDDYAGASASPHDENGQVVQEKPHKEANAAYSLYTTPTDIAKFMLLMFEPTPITQAMLTPCVSVNTLVPWHEDWADGEYDVVDDVSWGLGWGLQHIGNETSFWHWGDNGTYQCFAMGKPVTKSGIVVMTNGQNGRAVYMPLVEAVMVGKQPAINWLRHAYG